MTNNAIIDPAKNTRLIYKGDVMAGSFYLLIGVLSLIAAVCIYMMFDRLGFYYLSIGLAVFCLYMIGKGLVMMYSYYSRFQFYKNHSELTPSEIKEERRYTRYRILKKKKNRRRYIWTIIIGSIIAFGGIFHQEKGLIGATCIPVVLMAAIEFTVGLLTEFRLTEYLKKLHKLTLNG